MLLGLDEINILYLKGNCSLLNHQESLVFQNKNMQDMNKKQLFVVYYLLEIMVSSIIITVRSFHVSVQMLFSSKPLMTNWTYSIFTSFHMNKFYMSLPVSQMA